MPSKRERVLIYRIGSLGDTVVALPALHLIARSFPDAERRLLTNFPVSVKAPAAAAVLGGGVVDEYFRYVVGIKGFGGLVGLWWALVRWRPRVLVYLGGAKGVGAARRDARFFRLCGITRQIGVPLTQAMQENQALGAGGMLEPECERLARNIGELGDARLEDAASWDLHLTETETAKAGEMLESAGERPLIAVSLGTKVQANDWGTENWRAMLERVGRAYPGYALVLLGAAVEVEACESAATGWRAGAGQGSVAMNLCGRLTPRESAACLARAKVFIGHDSGPAHLAAAMQTTCVAIFSARHLPGIWFPYGRQHRVIYHRVECAGCELQTCTVERKRCLTSISVDEVVGEVRAVLGESAG